MSSGCTGVKIVSKTGGMVIKCKFFELFCGFSLWITEIHLSLRYKDENKKKEFMNTSIVNILNVVLVALVNVVVVIIG